MKTQIISAIGIAAMFLASCETQTKTLAENLIDSWRGKTVAYTTYPSNRSNGVEYFYPKVNKVLYINANGVCKFGSYKIEGNHLQFFYPNSGTSGIFDVVERDGQIILDEGDGIYQIGRIVSNDKLACDPTNLN